MTPMNLRLGSLACKLLKLSVCAALLVAAGGAQPASDWTIDTAAGTGLSEESGGGLGGDGGPAVEARLRYPFDVAVDETGSLYIVDTWNHRIRKVDSAGIVTTVAGSGTTGESGGGFSGDGGPAVEAQLRFPGGAALDGSGSLYIVDTWNHRIRKVDSAGIVTTIAGSGTTGEGGGGFGGDGGPAVEARLRYPYGAALDGSGNLYIADAWNHRIRKVDSAGIVTTIAGSGTEGYGGDGGPAVRAQLSHPQGVALDGSGNLYIADAWNHRIRKVDSAGIVTTIAGGGTPGGGRGRFGRDSGLAVRARLKYPQGMALDAAGNLYFADIGNHRIRKVDASGIMRTIAGTGGAYGGFGGDGGPALQAMLFSPRGMAADKAGNLYIADIGNHRIRRLTPPPGNVPLIF